ARAEHALGNSDGEIQAYRSYLEVHPGALGVGLMLLQRLQENGYYREAADYAATLQLDTLSEDSHAAEDRARAWYLESRVASAMDQPVQAALDLRKALRLGYDARQMAQAFAEDLSLYPDTGTLWLVHAEWLEHESPQRRVTGPKLQSYVDSLRQAGLLDPAIRPEARLRLEALLTHPGSAPPAHLALGELALADSDRTEALSQLERVPAGHGLDSAASLLRGQIYRDAGDIAGSVDAFLRYVMAQPNPGEMRFARGNVLWVLGQRSAALALWETDPQALRSHPEALSSLAGHYQTRQEPAMEIQTRQRLALLQPANHRNLIRLGEVLHGQGRTREAVNYWETALKQRPRDHQLLESLGRAYLTLGDQERGVNRLFQVTRMRPLDESSNALLADSLMRRGELGDALRVFSDILRSNPTHAGARKAIPELVLNVPSDDALRRSAAEIALGDGRMELAGELYSVLLRDHPEEEPLRMTLVDVRMRQGQLAEVERLLLEGIDEGSPRTQERLEMLADLQQRQERPAALAETLVRLRRLRPGDADLARRLGLLLVSLKRGTEAKPVLEASLSTQGGNPEVRLHLARLSLAAKDEPGTVTHFTALLAVQPDQPEALAWLIPHHLKAKEWAAALPLLNRQAELTPQDPVVRYNLVVSLLNLNRTGESRPHYDFLRGLDPVRADRLKGYFP
ncbi:MAG: tetratricopeptide repeat protein, partial [Deltaproteobacteria bacterium]|nr:tetratricopeptide repeat protein [Deltaproteobacteria bacterium]